VRPNANAWRIHARPIRSTPGLIPLYERYGRENAGRALETAVLLELERREYAVDYLKTRDGLEVDFLAEQPGEAPHLIQVSLDTQAESTWEREVRSLASAVRSFPGARATLVTLDPTPPAQMLAEGVTWVPASRWFLEPTIMTA
jgi:uncharacterized protein